MTIKITKRGLLKAPIDNLIIKFFSGKCNGISEKRGKRAILKSLFLCYTRLKEKGKKQRRILMSNVHKFGSDVDTDQIIASQYLLLPDIEAMKGYTFESLDPEFAKKVKPGDLVVVQAESRHQVY